MTAHFWMVAYAAGWISYVEIVGRLYLAEVVALIGVFFLRPLVQCGASPSLRRALLAYALILLGFMISDAVNGTEWSDAIKGWATMVFAALQLIFVFACLRRNVSSLLSFLCVLSAHKLAFGDVAYNANLGLSAPALVLDPGNMNYFKIRFVPFLMPAIALFSVLLYRLSTWASVAFLFVAGAIFVALDARSSGLTLLLASAFTMVIALRIKLNASTLVFGGLLGCVVGYGAYVAYVGYILAHNPTGQSGIQLARLANPYDPLALLLQGRSEWGVAWHAIFDKPIFGHGSWALDVDNRYVGLQALNTLSMDEMARAVGEKQFSIPGHSVFLMSWLWGGVVGACGALLLGYVMLVHIARSTTRAGLFLPALAVLFFDMAWAFLFSPLGSLRLFFPISLGLLLALSGEKTRDYGAWSPALARRRLA